jgi:hypothetical protein
LLNLNFKIKIKVKIYQNIKLQQKVYFDSGGFIIHLLTLN